MEAAAVRLAQDIAELRHDGGIPAHVRTVITVLPQQRVLEIRVEGLSSHHHPRSDPTRSSNYPSTGLRGDTPTSWRPLQAAIGRPHPP
jgi:hypothetical protein